MHVTIKLIVVESIFASLDQMYRPVAGLIEAVKKVADLKFVTNCELELEAIEIQVDSLIAAGEVKV